MFDLELRDISGPLAQFQAKKFDKPGLSEVVKSINASLANPVEEEIVSSLLDAMWPGLQTKVEAVPKRVGDTKKVRSQADILEELVLGVRGFDARLREAESNLNETGPRVRHRRTRFLMEMVDYAFMETEGQDPLGLLLVAAILREDLPAISELLNEGYRNIRLGRGNVLHHLPEQIHKLTRMMLSGPFIQEATNGSKDAHVILMELPRMIDRYLARISPKVRRSANSSTDVAPGA